MAITTTMRETYLVSFGGRRNMDDSLITENVYELETAILPDYFSPKKEEIKRGPTMIHNIPFELVQLILSFLDSPYDLVRSGLVCTKWHELSDNPLLWERLCWLHCSSQLKYRNTKTFTLE